jgi:putative sigma-54 modulation protein
MSIHFTSRNFEATDALRSYTEEKLNKLEKHFEVIMSIHVSFDIEKLNKVAEATIHVNKGELHVRVESDDMYAAVDELADKLHRQLVKHKEKTHKHRE